MPVNSFDNYFMSWKPSLKRDGTPLYKALARRLEEDISSGKLRAGTRLPPQRELADFLDVNLSTVQRAFRICSDKGLLTGEVGSGTYVAYSSATEMLSGRSREIIPLDITGPYPTDYEEMKLIQKELMDRDDFLDFFRYMPADLSKYQREAAKVLKRAGCSAESRNIHFANGGQNAMAAVFASLFRAGDRIGTDPVTYSNIKHSAQAFGIQIVPVEWEAGHMSPDGIVYAVKNYSIKGLYLQPFLHNPTGLIMDAATRKVIADLAVEYDLTVIEDGMYNTLVTGAPETIFDLAPENTVFIFSLSKTVNPALRVAYVATGDRYSRALAESLYSINLTVSPFILELAYRLSRDGGMELLTQRRLRSIVARNAVADEILSDHGLMPNPINPHRWLPLPEGLNSLDFERELRKKGVAVWASERFTVGRSSRAEALRLSVCGPRTEEDLRKGLGIIARELDRYMNTENDGVNDDEN